jgi:DNA-binding NarL/FixJ family response regulator
MSSLTEREPIVLQLAKQGLSDYRIARKINTDPTSVTRSLKNALGKSEKKKLTLHGLKRLG